MGEGETTRERAAEVLGWALRHIEHIKAGFEICAESSIEKLVFHRIHAGEMTAVLRYVIAELSAPAPAAMSDEELREACEAEARRVLGPSAEVAFVAGEVSAMLPTTKTDAPWLLIDVGSDERTGLLALHAALTVLAKKGGGEP